MQKNGFTLVELSIVLVIIGLLIGGILVAQSMIGTAQIQSLVRQIGQFDAAEANFETTYAQMSGDDDLMGSVPGNNNGVIVGSGFASNYWGGELAKYWSDLSNSGLVNPNGGSYIDSSAGTNDVSINTASQLPVARAGKKAYFFTGGSGVGTNYYVIGQQLGGSGSLTLFVTPAFTPSEALAVDSKMDDGDAHNGNVAAMEANAIATIVTTHTVTTSGTACTASAGGSKYKTSSSAVACVLAVRIGAAAGLPK